MGDRYEYNERCLKGFFWWFMTFSDLIMDHIHLGVSVGQSIIKPIGTLYAEKSKKKLFY